LEELYWLFSVDFLSLVALRRILTISRNAGRQPAFEMRKMAGFRCPASPPPPDLSNLTEEEKEIIQSVLQRQKQMEEETTQLQL